MSLDLGDLGSLATALGLVDSAGQPVSSWFAEPGRHLASVLSDPTQRAALVRLADELLGGSGATTDEAGRSWIPVVEVGGDRLRLFVTLQEGPGGSVVRIGAGVRVRTQADGVGCEVDVHVPLFVASGTTRVTDPVLVGTPGALVDASVRLTLPPDTAPGRVQLASVALTARVPTVAGDAATVALRLGGLRMPGAAEPRDLVVDAAHASELDDALLELVLGLVEAQVAGLPATANLRGLAGLLGLLDDDVPDFPVAGIARRGAVALADWLAEALEPDARADWISSLATLLGGSVIDAGTPQAAVEATVGGSTARLEVVVRPGASARPVVVPRVSAGVTGGHGTRLALTADLAHVDLGTGTVLALPHLALTARLDPPGDTPLLPPVTGPAGLQVAVGALEAGVALDATRRPVLVVLAEDADVGATRYDVLDLSTPDALAAVAAQAVTDAAAAVLAGAGSASQAVSVLLGLTAPASAAGVPLLDPGDLLRDPVGAVRRRWQALLGRPAAEVRAVLEAAQDALSDDRVRGDAVTGQGTTVDPWLVPLAPGVRLQAVADASRLRIGVQAELSATDLAGTGVGVGLDVTTEIVDADLAARTAAFLPGVSGRLRLAGPGGARLQLGAAGLAVSTEELGARVSWSPAGGARVEPVLTGARLVLGGGEVPLPALTLDGEGRLALDAAGWAAVEALAGAVAQDVAQRLRAPWLADLVALLGWADGAAGTATAGTALAGGAPQLELARLVDDPGATLGAFLSALVADEQALQALLQMAGELLSGSPLAGRAAPSRPWAVPLVRAAGALAGRAAEDLPALTVSTGPDGAQAPPSLAEPALRNWLPGEDGLQPAALVAALDRDGEIDDTLADLLAGRGDLTAGLEDLLDRWAGTDGLVTLPEETLPPGVTAHRPSEVTHGTVLGGPDMAEVLGDLYEQHLGGAPGTLVLVAVAGQERHGAPDVLTGDVVDALPADRVLDLTAPSVPPESFVPPAGSLAAHLWAVRLGTRTASRLPAGHPSGPDPDGVAGQAARLRRVLAPLTGAGRDVLVVAHGGAGHAALRAVEGLAGVRGVVTVGTPWSVVTLDTLDAVPAGEALRLLRSLLRVADDAAADPADEATDPEEPDDPDLALARAAVDALLDRDPYPDPLADLRPPTGLGAPPGVPVHAVVGSLAPPALRRALTAVTASALSARARARARESGAAPGELRVGVRLPVLVPAGTGGLTARVRVGLELLGVAPGGGPVAGPTLVVRLDVGAGTGWLVGGPDPGRGSGGARPLACRRLTAEVRVPVLAWTPTGTTEAAATSRLVLHDAEAFGVRRDRWVVEGSGTQEATTLLPEVRALLGEVAARIGRAAGVDPDVAALREALLSLGVLGPDGGADAVTIERLLLDPGKTLAAAVGDALRAGRLAGALRRLTGDTRPDAGTGFLVAYGDDLTALVDLAQRTVTVTATGSPGSATAPALPWRALLLAGTTGVSATLTLGPDLDQPSATGTALTLTLPGNGLTAGLRRRSTAGAVHETRLWPSPDSTAVLDELTTLVPGLALGAVLEAARSSLAGVSAAAAALVDDLLDAMGVLAPAPAGAPPGTPRRLRPVVPLLSDPAGWLRSGTGGLGAALPAVLDATRRLLGITGTAGSVPLADGVSLRARQVGGRLTVALDVDATQFTAPGSGLGLVLRGSAGVSVAPDGTAPTLADLAVEVGVAGRGGLRLRVGPDAGGAGDAVGVGLVLAPEGSPEIVLLPGGPGLGGLADAAAAGAVAALPALLDALAAGDPTGTPATAQEVAGRLVSRLGDALALRSGAPPRFDAAALTAFGTDPAAALAARGAALAASGLTLLTEAVAPLLGTPATRSVAVDAGALLVRVGPLTLRWRPGAARVQADLLLTALPGIGRLDVAAAVDPSGLAALDVAVGPVALDAGVVTLAPFARVRAGAAPALGRAVELGLATGVGTAAERRLVARWDLATSSFGLVAARLGPAPQDVTELTDDEAVTLAVADALLGVAGGVVLAVPAVQSALTEPVLGTTVAALLEGVLLAPGDRTRLDPALSADLSEPLLLLRRLGVLAANLASAPDAALPLDGRLTLRATSRSDGTNRVLGLNLAIDGSWELNPGSDVVVSLEDDARWITPPSGTVPEGLTVEVLALPPTGPPQVRPSLTVGGLGVRIGRSSGPLLDAGLSIGSVAVHLFGAIAPAGASVSVAGGARLELAGIGVPLAGARGGDNAVAKGLMAQPGTGEDAPTPRFSPALSVQKHVGGPLLIALVAGEGSGPWWLTIQREFGPIYLEQVGLAVVNRPSGVESIGVLLDGKVSLLGLSAAVDDLSLTYVVAGGGSALDPSRWRVDLAGFAVTADVGGITLAGGLRRFTPSEGGVEYLGMLMARVAVYGLTVYGGYGVVGPAGDQYTSIFLFGAVNGPLGGPPAFFVTGIGGGFGINRRLSLPSDLSQFGDFPLIKALDPAARAGDPFAELEQARTYFAAERGAFWFAAGLSFSSFALVDGIAVVAVRVGGGFELSLLGLARMALPRPEAALVSIEMALVARFSTREGVILVQAQLTDNSWLLNPAVRLTGGFAFASWFTGPNRGQFVVTMGGYHPDFHRDGYPVVPRLGLRWQIGSAISVVGGSYFALTSEALMAGTRVEITARLGPGWAHAVFGADGIVFFDPFWLKVTVYASIDAGVTIDVWIGEITITVHLSAKVEVTGPPFRAVARFEVGPVGLTLAIGSSNSQPRYLDWDRFVPKYLEQGAARADGRVAARVLTAVTGPGAVPPSGSASSGGDRSPDGTPERPFRVVAEFELTITSTAPVKALVAGGSRRELASSHVVSVAPMGLAGPADVLLTLTMVGPPSQAVDRIDRLDAVPQRLGAFPVGTWGTAQDASSPTVPAGDVISATDRVLLRGEAEIPLPPGGGLPPAIPYRQVETGARRLNPLITEDAARRGVVRRAAEELAGTVPQVEGAARLDVAATMLAERGGRSAADVAAWRSSRASAPILSALAEGLGQATRTVTPKETAPPAPREPDPARPPVARALLTAPDAGAPFAAAPDREPETPGGTTVSRRLLAGVESVRLVPPSLATLDAGLLAAVPARLLRVPPAAVATGGTVVAPTVPPTTVTPVVGAGLTAARTNDVAVAGRLAALTVGLAGVDPRTDGRRGSRPPARGRPAGAVVSTGEIAVLELPDAARDTDAERRPAVRVTQGWARVVAMGAAGGVLADALLHGSQDGGREDADREDATSTLTVPRATRGLVVVGTAPPAAVVAGAGAEPRPEVLGWCAGVPLPSATDGVLVAAGAVLDVRARTAVRGVAPLRAGWVLPEELVAGDTAAVTTFARPLGAVAVVLEGGSTDDVALGVEGAARPSGKDAAPVVVSDGPRSVAVFALVGSRAGTAVTVSTAAGRRLAGVLGVPPGDDAAHRLARAVARLGVARLVPPPTEPGPGSATLIWTEG